MADNIYIYHTSPNQKSIITKKTDSGAGAPYGICNVAATLLAAQSLSDRAFKLYIRMNLHQDGHTYALSPVEIVKSIGMSDKRYREAVKELIDKGYLVQSEKNKSLYVFYELPKRKEAPAESATSSGENGEITRPFWEDNPAISGGEIVHNITSHNTVNNTDDNRMADGSFPVDYHSYIQRKRELKKQSTESRIAVFDEDDSRMYYEPEAVSVCDSDLDMPF